jgi:hypothetical protein
MNRKYNTIRMANVVAKSIQRKAFKYTSEQELNKSTKYLANGSCRLCRPCNLIKNEPCKYPQLMHPSLEATGIDVNDLITNAFGFELQWYKKDKFPDYQCVVGGILTNEPKNLVKELRDYYKRNYFTEKSLEDNMSSLEKETSFHKKIVPLCSLESMIRLS